MIEQIGEDKLNMEKEKEESGVNNYLAVVR